MYKEINSNFSKKIKIYFFGRRDKLANFFLSQGRPLRAAARTPAPSRAATWCAASAAPAAAAAAAVEDQGLLGRLDQGLCLGQGPRLVPGPGLVPNLGLDLDIGHIVAIVCGLRYERLVIILQAVELIGRREGLRLDLLLGARRGCHRDRGQRGVVGRHRVEGEEHESQGRIGRACDSINHN